MPEPMLISICRAALIEMSASRRASPSAGCTSETRQKEPRNSMSSISTPIRLTSLPSGTSSPSAPRGTISSGRIAATIGVPSASPCVLASSCSSPIAIRSPSMRPSTWFISPTKSATNSVSGSRYISVGVPTCSITPWFMTTIRSAIVSASSWSWVTMTVVTPRRRCSSFISWRRWPRTLASSADSGSSSSSSPGDVASALASAMRCCWPPDSCAGYFLPCSGRPTSSSNSATRSTILAFSSFRFSRPKATFFHAVRFGNSA